MLFQRKMAKNKSKTKYLFGHVEPFPKVVNFVMNAAELKDYLPKGKKFVIKRVYWVHDWQNEFKSGHHCHINEEEELFIAMRGEAEIVLDDNGRGKREFPFKANDTVFIPKYVWHGFKDATPDFLFLALTTTNYDPQRRGYCEDYEEFKKIVK